MDQHFGWWVDTSKLTLSDTSGGATTWVHALPLGSYQHPLYGQMTFDAAKLNALASSVKTKARGIDPDIDYDHKEDPAKGHQAAGWVKDARVDPTGLYLQVDFTADAAKDITEKKYRYFSAEFVDEWTDPQGVAHKDVLFGGGLTNRPYMKNLLPVNLSELLTGPPKEPPTEVDVELKKLRELLGLPEATDENGVIAKLTEMATQVTTLTTEKTALEAEVKSLKDPKTDPKKDPELMKLIEGSPAFAKMYAELEDKDRKLAEATTAMRLAEVTTQLAELQRGRVFALAPVVREELQNILLKSSPEAGKTLAEFLEKVMDGKALVDLSERGYTGRNREPAADSTGRFNDLVQAFLKENKGSNIGDATEAVAKANPQLFADYREQSYLFKS
jgi:phage I-like protein